VNSLRYGIGLVADPRQQPGYGIGADRKDSSLGLVRLTGEWPLGFNELPAALEPIRKRVALVAGLAVTKKKPDHTKCGDSARKKDDPFPPFRHGTVIMELLNACASGQSGLSHQHKSAPMAPFTGQAKA